MPLILIRQREYNESTEMQANTNAVGKFSNLDQHFNTDFLKYAPE